MSEAISSPGGGAYGPLMGQEPSQSEPERFQHLLVVDDNPGDRRLIEEAFTDTSFDPTIHSATTGEDALEFLRRQGEDPESPRPDVVLLDWSLPDMSGEEVLEKLSVDQQELQVILMSGSEPQMEEITSSDTLADAFVAKPDDPKEYLEIVRSIK